MADVLLLETDRQLAKNAQDFFSRAGHRLVCHSDPQAAVSTAYARRPDVIIMDLFLASRSGIEFLYELRSYPEWQVIPVIITGRLSADELASFQPAFKELDILQYLPKQTSSLRQLLNAIQNCLQPA